MVSATLRLYDTREKHLIESFVDDVMELVELVPNKDALVSEPWPEHTRCELSQLRL